MLLSERSFLPQGAWRSTDKNRITDKFKKRMKLKKKNKDVRSNSNLENSPRYCEFQICPCFSFLVHSIAPYISQTCEHHLIIASCKLCSFSASFLSPCTGLLTASGTNRLFNCEQDSTHTDVRVVAFRTTRNYSRFPPVLIIWTWQLSL
jgi:hypothetical protein